MINTPSSEQRSKHLGKIDIPSDSTIPQIPEGTFNGFNVLVSTRSSRTLSIPYTREIRDAVEDSEQSTKTQITILRRLDGKRGGALPDSYIIHASTTATRY